MDDFNRPTLNYISSILYNVINSSDNITKLNNEINNYFQIIEKEKKIEFEKKIYYDDTFNNQKIII